MKKIFILLMLSAAMLLAKSLDRKIADMFILGFYGTDVSSNSAVMHDICDVGLGGVILFDRHPTKHNLAKNISSPSQLKHLTSQLGRCSHKPLIAIDEEGGLVQRLKSKSGFANNYPKASLVSKRGRQYAKRVYTQMAKELHSYGINYNFAPVADLSINPKNRVIVKVGRSFGKDAERVAAYDKIFIDAMRQNRVLTSLKHFPGHGSSLGDTHKGFVDVTNLWSVKELEPYEYLNDLDNIDSIMVAHIFNRRLDSRYPASLSYKVVHNLLRKKLGYDGVVISDDLQMGAISKHYKLKDILRLSINAGVDILLFGNQLSPGHEVKISKLVAIVKELIAEGKISKSRIEQANRRIDRMRSTIGLGK